GDDRQRHLRLRRARRRPPPPQRRGALPPAAGAVRQAAGGRRFEWWEPREAGRRQRRPGRWRVGAAPARGRRGERLQRRPECLRSESLRRDGERRRGSHGVRHRRWRLPARPRRRGPADPLGDARRRARPGLHPRRPDRRLLHRGGGGRPPRGRHGRHRRHRRRPTSTPAGRSSGERRTRRRLRPRLLEGDAMALLELEQVTKTYRMGDVDVHALRGVSLSVDEGEFVAVMGSSGSGKSTLMNILGCLDRPTTGAYRLAGREVSRLDRNQLAEVRNKTLGFVFQSFNQLSRTSALENADLPMVYGGYTSKERYRRARDALVKVGLGERLDHHPNQLSGGQQQRVAIARALVNSPKLILADEPTGNLDSRTSLEIMALFQELGRSGMTIVLVTHETDIATYAARVVTMRDGKVLSDQRQTPVAAVPPPAAQEASP